MWKAYNVGGNLNHNTGLGTEAYKFLTISALTKISVFNIISIVAFIICRLLRKL